MTYNWKKIIVDGRWRSDYLNKIHPKTHTAAMQLAWTVQYSQQNEYSVFTSAVNGSQMSSRTSRDMHKFSKNTEATSKF
jgi:hypothetical protein